jgi:hypothetical protein
MSNSIDEILDGCLQQLFQGESIENCLKNYPELASQLEPLLNTGLLLLKQASTIHPDPRFKDKVRTRLQGMLSARKERKTAFPLWRRRWAIAMIAVLLIAVAGMGTVVASAQALPHEPLYSVKLATEQAQLCLALSDVRRAELHIKFAERRAMEMAEIARQGRENEISLLAEQIAAHLDQVWGVKSTEGVAMGKSEPSPPAMLERGKDSGKIKNQKLREKLTASRQQTLSLLETALGQTPKDARPSLEQAIRKVAQDYDEAIVILES